MKKNVSLIKDIGIDNKLKLKEDFDIEKFLSYKTKEIKEFVKKIETEIKKNNQK